MKWDIRNQRRIAPTALLALASFALHAGCGDRINEVRDAINGPYHKLSVGGGVYVTIKKRATNCMVLGYDLCRNDGGAPSACGQAVLKQARDKIEPSLSSDAKELWNGELEIGGYHPNLGKGFRDEEGGDLATAIRDLRSRNHECLRVHWLPTGTNWTTMDDGAAECSLGDPVFLNNQPLNCPAP